MQDGVEIVDTLTSVFTCWQDRQKEDELMGYLNQYLYLPQCQNFIMTNVINMKNGKTEELQHIYKELIQRGEFALAQKVNFLVSGDITISEESYTLLESYFKSEDFYKKLENALINLNRPSV
jgi:hypothetical protein